MSNSIEIMEQWFKRVWSNEEEDAIDEMLVPDTNASGLGSQPRIGPEQFKEFHRCFLALMRNIDIVIDKRMQDGDWYSLLVTFNARRRDNGEPIAVTGNVYGRVIDDKIVEAYNHFDFIGLFEQLGLMPKGSFDNCISGRKSAW